MTHSKETKKALLVGASGLVGNELLHYLLNAPEYKQVTILVRKPLGLNHPKLNELIVDFDHLAQYQNHYGVDDVFCCLGTTMKKVKSKEAFKKVDVEYPLELAKLSKAQNAQQFLVVSSLGANPKSRIFYSKMKGLLEDSLKDIEFPTLHIFRPSLLLGKRGEFRLGESAATLVSTKIPFLFKGPFRQYRPIAAKTVAFGMYKAAQNNSRGVFIHPSELVAQVRDDDQTPDL